MSVPALSVDEIANLTRIASEYKMSFADLVRELLRNYAEQAQAEKEKRKMIRERLANLPPVDPEEAAEILAYIDNMTPEDREVVSESVIYVIVLVDSIMAGLRGDICKKIGGLKLL